MLWQRLDPDEERDQEGAGLPRAGLRHADDVPVGQPDGDGLPLDGRGVLVADLVNDVKNLLGHARLAPVTNRSRGIAALVSLINIYWLHLLTVLLSFHLDADVVVLAEDSPVSLRHPVQLLV